MGFIFNALSSIPYGYLQAIGRADLPTKIQIFELLAYFPLLWGMIHWLGILGAAVAWAIRVILEMGLLFLVARNTGKMDLSTLRESRLFQAATVFLVSCGAGYFISLLIWKIVAVCMATLMFAAGLWLFSFNRGEKTWILSTARNFRAR
jgi:O-antigen/teichoic acid export membrane protein